MPAALVIGARNLGRSVIERLVADGWEVTGAARSPETLERIRRAGAHALEVDVTDQASVLAALEDVASRCGRVDLVVNAASPYGGGRGGPFGGGPLAQAAASGFDDWAAAPARGAFAFLSACARFLADQAAHAPGASDTGTAATVIQVTGGSSRRAMPGRGLWAAGAFAVRALTQAAALELREHRIHVALLVVDAVIDRDEDGADLGKAGSGDLAGAVAYLASQGARAMTHELQVTPARDQWVP